VLRRLTHTPDSIRAGRRYRLVRLIPIVTALALASSACTSRADPGTESATRNGTVTELRSVSELEERFNEDSGKIRLILLISPT